MPSPHSLRTLLRSAPGASQRPPRHGRQRGQALVLFVLMGVVLVGAVAIVTDVSWLWYGQQRMQRAADAAALAGAIYLPGDPTSAYSTARAEAAKNGFTNGVNGVTVTPLQDNTNRRRLSVTVSGNVRSFFSRVMGFSQFSASASSRAEYVLPVPMGSPENYYGIGYYLDSVSNTSTSTSTTVGNAGWRVKSTNPTGNWTTPANADGTTNTSYAISTTSTGSAQQWGGFNMATALPTLAANQTMAIDGIQLELRDLLSGSGSPTSTCQLNAELSWDNGTTWSTAVPHTVTTTKTVYTLGSATSTAAWGAHTWTRTDATNLRVRLTFNRVAPTANCNASRTVSEDTLRVNFYYTITTTTTTTTITHTQRDLTSPTGGAINQQNFWGAMQSQGVPSIQGDAYQTRYEIRTGTDNGAYNYDDYFNYGIDMPAGTTNGKVYVWDPGFCDGTRNLNTGEYWTGDNSSTDAPISSFFELYNTQNTPYDQSDDTLVGSSGDTFRQLSYYDSLTGRAAPRANAAGADCSTGVAWHDDWWQLASGLSGGAGGQTYRLHTLSTDKNSLSDQNPSTGLNAFAFYASASGGTPRIYGIGAMEAYVRLPGGTASEFYLSQIDKVHAGKTMVIDLWDPGDTGSLSASLQILQPTTSTYSPASFSWTSSKGTAHSSASSCNGLSGTSVTSVVTNTGGSSRFNGCWVTITIVLPSNYTAPHPSSDSITSESGWWKIKYTMGGSASEYSSDLTTWKVAIRGNPVHLVP